MSLILNIETATTVCSVALGDGDGVVHAISLDEGYTHAENLHVFIDRLLREASVTPANLAAVAVSRGPGSYTGLRIGSAAAKGLSFALNIPLIAVDTLQAMAAMARAAEVSSAADLVFRPMIDARRMEVYTAEYDNNLSRTEPPEAVIVDDAWVSTIASRKRICFFGNALPKCRHLLENVSGAILIDGVVPDARYMVPLASHLFTARSFENVDAYEPLYLKEFLVIPAKPRGNGPAVR